MINMSLCRELGPVLAATMLAGRVGSAMAAELGTMRVTEQIDALVSMGANPIHYLVVPRFLGLPAADPVAHDHGRLHGRRRRLRLQRAGLGIDYLPLLAPTRSSSSATGTCSTASSRACSSARRSRSSAATAASTALRAPKASAGPRRRRSSLVRDHHHPRPVPEHLPRPGA